MKHILVHSKLTFSENKVRKGNFLVLEKASSKRNPVEFANVLRGSTEKVVPK